MNLLWYCSIWVHKWALMQMPNHKHLRKDMSLYRRTAKFIPTLISWNDIWIQYFWGKGGERSLIYQKLLNGSWVSLFRLDKVSILTYHTVIENAILLFLEWHSICAATLVHDYCGTYRWNVGWLSAKTGNTLHDSCA